MKIEGQIDQNSANLNIEIYKTFLRDIKEELKKRRYVPRLWIRKLKFLRYQLSPN